MTEGNADCSKVFHEIDYLFLIPMCKGHELVYIVLVYDKYSAQAHCIAGVCY